MICTVSVGVGSRDAGVVDGFGGPWTVWWFTQSRKHPAGAGVRFGSAHRRWPTVSTEHWEWICRQRAWLRSEVSGCRRRIKGWCLARRKFSFFGRAAAGRATQRQQRGERGTPCRRMARSLVLDSLDVPMLPPMKARLLALFRFGTLANVHPSSVTVPLGPSPHPLLPPAAPLPFSAPSQRSNLTDHHEALADPCQGVLGLI